jgi:hypothetical protein
MTSVIVFFASILGCGFPVVAAKVKWMKIPPPVFFFCKHFGTGVLIATAFVHVCCVFHEFLLRLMADRFSSCQQLSHRSTTHVFPSSSPTNTPRCQVSS